MPQHDLTITLRQMLAYAREAMEMSSRTTRSDLEGDMVLTRALVHTLEMVGEAARRVGESDRARHPSIPWQDIVDLRNRLIHGYDQVDLRIVWEITVEDLPPLARRLERILGSA